MPIYEYQCKACTKTFELLVRSAPVPPGPPCAPTPRHKRMSRYAQGTPALSSTYVPPGTRGHPDN